MNSTNDFSNLTDSFKDFIGNKTLMFQVLDLFPLMIQAFSPDGTSMFINRAFMAFNNIPDASRVVGLYNLKNDPVCLEIMGQDIMDKLFRGETGCLEGFPAPIQNVADHDYIDEKPFEAATLDIFALPVWDGGAFLFTICIYIAKNVYTGRTEINKAKEYIDNNWLEAFDGKAVARAANVSPSHLYALFRSNTGMTINDYYKKVKVEHIKEKLADENLTIAEAFSFCGADSRGGFIKTFKELTGMTPTEYRNSLK